MSKLGFAIFNCISTVSVCTYYFPTGLTTYTKITNKCIDSIVTSHTLNIPKSVFSLLLSQVEKFALLVTQVERNKRKNRTNLR